MGSENQFSFLWFLHLLHTKILCTTCFFDQLLTTYLLMMGYSFTTGIECKGKFITRTIVFIMELSAWYSGASHFYSILATGGKLRTSKMLGMARMENLAKGHFANLASFSLLSCIKHWPRKKRHRTGFLPSDGRPTVTSKNFSKNDAKTSKLKCLGENSSFLVSKLNEPVVGHYIQLPETGRKNWCTRSPSVVER